VDYDEQIRLARGVDSITALCWLSEKRAAVRWEKDQTVTVRVGKKRRRRKTLLEAISAHVFEP